MNALSFIVPPTTMSLDHLILLSKPSRLDDTVDQLSAWFTVVEGGTHVPPVTANSLVPLPSGTYLELIHFLAPPADDSIHWWAKKLPGHIDWCLLGEPTQNQRQAVKDVQPDRDGWEYAEGVRGGRTRPDGQEVQCELDVPSLPYRSTDFDLVACTVTQGLSPSPVKLRVGEGSRSFAVITLIAPSESVPVARPRRHFQSSFRLADLNASLPRYQPCRRPSTLTLLPDPHYRPDGALFFRQSVQGDVHLTHHPLDRLYPLGHALGISRRVSAVGDW